MKVDILLCQCGDPAHQVLLYYNTKDKLVYLAVHLFHTNNIFKRIWIALKYIFSNKKSIYGDFDEVVLRQEDAQKLQFAVDVLKDENTFSVLVNKNDFS